VVVSAGGPVVYVVEGGKAAARPVRLGAWLDGEWIVEAGLAAGETLVTDGVQRLRPGAEVEATPAQPARKQ
jgi:membrane fusion protein (multidrug efflux system)